MYFSVLPFSVWIVLAFLWGSVWGSFGNVVIFRLPRGRSILFPPSACPACNAPIRPWHNIPVFSWLWLRGRCASCKAPFSVRYAIVEALCGLLAVALLLHFDAQGVWDVLRVGQWFVIFLFLWLLVVLSGIDWDTFILPDSLTLGGLVVFSVLSVLLGLQSWSETLWGAGLGFVALSTLSWAYRMLRHREGLGLGDAKLLSLIGAVLGPWALMIVIFWGAVCGLLISILFLLLRVRRDPPIPYVGISEADPEFDALFRTPPESWMVTPMPFGPFLSIGAIFAFFSRDLWFSLFFW